jgi:hypothetical protein
LNTTYDYKEREMKKMIRMFLSGILCGVMMMAAVTFAFTIPGNNNQWRADITERGGGVWYFDRNGRLGWEWTVRPVSEGRHSPTIVVPEPKAKGSSNSSHEQL